MSGILSGLCLYIFTIKVFFGENNFYLFLFLSYNFPTTSTTVPITGIYAAIKKKVYIDGSHAVVV